MSRFQVRREVGDVKIPREARAVIHQSKQPCASVRKKQFPWKRMDFLGSEGNGMRSRFSRVVLKTSCKCKAPHQTNATEKHERTSPRKEWCCVRRPNNQKRPDQWRYATHESARHPDPTFRAPAFLEWKPVGNDPSQIWISACFAYSKQEPNEAQQTKFTKSKCADFQSNHAR